VLWHPTCQSGRVQPGVPQSRTDGADICLYIPLRRRTHFDPPSCIRQTHAQWAPVYTRPCLFLGASRANGGRCTCAPRISRSEALRGYRALCQAAKCRWPVLPALCACASWRREGGTDPRSTRLQQHTHTRTFARTSVCNGVCTPMANRERARASALGLSSTLIRPG